MFQENEINFTLIVIVGTVTFIVFNISFLILFRGFHLRRLKYFKEKQRLESDFKQQLLQTQIEIQEQTLKTISQEIHDNIGQVLSLVKLNLSTISLVADITAQNKIDSSKDLISKAINDLRDLSRSLHGDKIAGMELQEAVENELRIIQNTGQFETGLQVTGQPYKLEPQKEMVLYRIAQEALHNSVKHSRASLLQVQLNYQPGLFSLIIEDDGNGFDINGKAPQQTGIGLKSMHKRAGLIGGTFTLQSAADTGTIIKIEIPKT